MVCHGHGNLPSGHKRTMTTKRIANIKTTNHAGAKDRSTGKLCSLIARATPPSLNQNPACCEHRRGTLIGSSPSHICQRPPTPAVHQSQYMVVRRRYGLSYCKAQGLKPLMINVGNRHAAMKNNAHETISKRYVVRDSSNLTYALDRSNSAATISQAASGSAIPTINIRIENWIARVKCIATSGVWLPFAQLRSSTRKGPSH
jgi:hypothetical protein